MHLKQDVLRELQGCLRGVCLISKVFVSIKDVSRKFKGVNRKFQGCVKEVSRLFQGSFRDISRVFQESSIGTK